MKQLTSAQIETLVKKFDAQRSNVPEYPPITLVQEMMTQYGLPVVTPDAGSNYGNLWITVHTDQKFTNGIQNLYAMSLMTDRPEGFELIKHGES